MRVRRVVTTRAGGHSRTPYASFNLSHTVGDDPSSVALNRTRLADELGLGTDRLIWMEQVHGVRVQRVDEPAPSPVPETDGLVTATPGLALAALAADCVPVLFADPIAGVVGVCHAGRVGARDGVVPATLRAMCELGARTDQVEVLLGPAVCGPCYEVPETMRADIETHLPGSATTTRTGTPALDLRAGLRGQLTSLGVDAIVEDPRCTVEEEGLFSHRRERTTGRQAAVIWIES